jgi:3-hydroxyisobutyrate dehydrogenase-like beta-hydroxyacid dehydrogenase
MDLENCVQVANHLSKFLDVVQGKGMVRCLLQKTTVPMVVWNRSADACSELLSEFPDRVTVAATPKDVVQAAGTTYCMLSTAEASAAVVSV